MKFILFSTLMLVPVIAYAQETTAGGNLNTEASWTALHNLISQAKNTADIANITANGAMAKAIDIEKCNTDHKFYTSAGCKAPDIKINYKSCSMAIIRPMEDNAAGKALKMNIDTELNAEIYCPAGQTIVGLNYKTVGGAVCCPLTVN